MCQLLIAICGRQHHTVKYLTLHRTLKIFKAQNGSDTPPAPSPQPSPRGCHLRRTLTVMFDTSRLLHKSLYCVLLQFAHFRTPLTPGSPGCDKCVTDITA